MPPVEMNPTWLHELRSGDASAIQKLWDTFSERLVKLAEKNVRSISRPTTDQDDVTSSVFKSIWKGAKAGRFRDVKSSEEVWWILAAMARRKCIDHARREQALKRGGTAPVFSLNDIGPNWIETIVSREPDQKLVISMEDEYTHLMQLIDDDVVRRVVTLRIEGLTVKEIAAELDLSVPTVERKIRYAREIWKDSLSDAPEE